jgi:hypothetical protein
MSEASRWQDWIFERHSREELAVWAPALKCFRYCRANGGHANDGDELKVAIRFGSEEELRSQFEALGIPLEEMPAVAPRPVAGAAYRGDEWAKFLPFVDSLPHLRQPSHISFNKIPCHVWIYPQKWELCIVDPAYPYEVTSRSIEHARAIDPLFKSIGNDIVDPPLDNKRCICPKFYPDLWDRTPNRSLDRPREG